jgi:hypothetical protein
LAAGDGPISFVNENKKLPAQKTGGRYKGNRHKGNLRDGDMVL